MDRKDIAYTDFFPEIMKVLTGRGLLLAAYDAGGRANAMTIGWGSVGSVWGMPVWTVLVRPSRYTYECIQHSGCFSVNVPPKSLARACGVCGSESGRDGDKLARCGLTVQKGSALNVPLIAECPIVYECDVVHSNFIVPGDLIQQLKDGPYANGDYHRIYYGRIRSARAADGCLATL